MDWLTGLFTLLGIALGAGISEYRHWREGRERFRVMTFEKRLAAHQKAYYWWNNLNRVLNFGDAEQIRKIANKAREWWNGNCLFLDTNSRRDMVELINYSFMYASDSKTAQEHIWEQVMKTAKSIVSGIGFEYLPEALSKPEELEETM